MEWIPWRANSLHHTGLNENAKRRRQTVTENWNAKRRNQTGTPNEDAKWRRQMAKANDDEIIQRNMPPETTYSKNELRIMPLYEEWFLANK